MLQEIGELEAGGVDVRSRLKILPACALVLTIYVELDQARDMMSRQIKNMSRLIEDLLDVSRVTQGKTRLRRERVEIMELLRRAVDLVRHNVEVRGQARLDHRAFGAGLDFPGSDAEAEPALA